MTICVLCITLFIQDDHAFYYKTSDYINVAIGHGS